MKLIELQKKLSARAPKTEELVRNDLAFQIGLQIELARARMGMTQKELAERVGTKQPSIARVESGASLPSLRFLQTIASALEAKLAVSLSDSASNTVSHTFPAQTQGQLSPYQPDQNQLNHIKISYK